MKSKWIKALLIALVVAASGWGLVAGFLWWTVSGWRDVFINPYRFREVPAQELLADLETVFDINFPEGIREVKTARTFGDWDSKLSSFAVRFTAEPSVVSRFAKSFPTEMRFGEYDDEFDERRSLSSRHPPEWFIGRIVQGKQGDYELPHSGGSMTVYVDTSREEEFAVYVTGYGYLEERAEERGKR